MIRFSRVAVVASAVLLCSCGDAPIKPQAKPTPEQALVPVNLLLNSGQVLDDRTAAELVYLQKEISTSGLFAGVQLGASPWPYTLRMDVKIDCSMGAAETAGALASAVTLFVVPHTETCVYSILAAFFDGAKLLDTRQYSMPYKKTIQMFGQTQVKGDEEGLDQVYAKMMDDCLKNPPLPRAKPAKPSLNL